MSKPRATISIKAVNVFFILLNNLGHVMARIGGFFMAKAMRHFGDDYWIDDEVSQ